MSKFFVLKNHIKLQRFISNTKIGRIITIHNTSDRNSKIIHIYFQGMNMVIERAEHMFCVSCAIYSIRFVFMVISNKIHLFYL